MDNVQPASLEFDWAAKRWEDELTGTDVVCLSPALPIHFRNTYFRVNMCTRDGRTMVLMGQDPERKASSELWRIDLETGATDRLCAYQGGGLSSWAVAPQSRLLHAIERRDGRVEILRIDLDSGEQSRITPTDPRAVPSYAECSADDRYMYPYTSLKEIPEGTSKTERIAMLGAEPGHNLLFRIDLTSGQTDVVYETHDWWIGHPNPNPVYPHLFMCCQEGFIWTERYPQPDNFQRIRIHDFSTGEWRNLQGAMQQRGAHEHWGANGRRVYSHNLRYGCHQLFKMDLDTGTSVRYVGPLDYGMSIHTAPAPDESFVIGDGLNFCRADLGTIEGLGNPGDGDNPWSWDGIDSESPGETIWQYEYPQETMWPEDMEYESVEDFYRAIEENPDKTVKTTPVCKFRSLSKMKLDGTRLESNAHVTPDSRWAVFQSASEEGLFEVWAARVKG